LGDVFLRLFDYYWKPSCRLKLDAFSKLSESLVVLDMFVCAARLPSL